MNLGKDASTFKYYTMCGLQEGFEPFAVNMNREVTMWFSKRLPTFVNVPKDHSHIAVSKRSDIFVDIKSQDRRLEECKHFSSYLAGNQD